MRDCGLRWAPRRNKVETEPVGTRLEVYKSLEIRIAYWPGRRREIVLVVADNELPFELLRRIAKDTRNEEDLLMNLYAL